jgi:hypothetical protein
MKASTGCRATPRGEADAFMTRRSQMEEGLGDLPTIDLESLRPWDARFDVPDRAVLPQEEQPLKLTL